MFWPGYVYLTRVRFDQGLFLTGSLLTRVRFGQGSFWQGSFWQGLFCPGFVLYVLRSNYAKNQTVYKKSIALLLRRYWFSSDDVKMKFVYFFMLSKIEVSTFQKINIFCHFEVHLGSKISENGYINSRLLIERIR